MKPETAKRTNTRSGRRTHKSLDEEVNHRREKNGLKKNIAKPVRTIPYAQETLIFAKEARSS